MPNIPSPPQFDYWGHSFETQTGTTRGSLYYYFMDTLKIKSRFDKDKYNRLTIPPVSAVQSVTLCPYLRDEDVHYSKHEFDFQRFPVSNLSDYEPTEQGEQLYSTLYRIESILKTADATGKITGDGSKNIGETFPRYHTPLKDIGGKRSWANESKLYNFPYSYGLLFDGISQPIEFEYHNCPSPNVQVKCRIPLSNLGNYNLFINNYKSDINGSLEGTYNTRASMLPISSSAYTDYMATSASTHATSKFSSLITAGAVGGALLTGGTSLAVAGVASAVVAGASAYQSIAKEKDLRRSPNTVTNNGSDIISAMENSSGYLQHIRYFLKPEFLTKIGDYFAMYGYKQNKLMSPNLRSRHYYNYIKTQGANIKASGIPKEHYEKIRQIYDNGTTIWHVSNSNVTPLDYSLDNKES